jgi:subtilisin family serine protease
MTHTRHRQPSAAGHRKSPASKHSRQGPKRFRRPWIEVLEQRLLLDGAADYNSVTPAWFAQVARAAPEPAIYGPMTATAGGGSGGWESSAEVAQWIVRLTETATEQAGSVAGAKTLLDSGSVAFDVVRGLGLPGQVLVRASGSADQVRAALADNTKVATFEADGYVFAQQLPNDPDFPSLTSLHNVGQFGSTSGADIDAPEAWAVNTGSTNVVVGVIDSGIDVAHPDLYLNIWLNQGEIPAALKSNLTDADSDGRITFYDLNDPANAPFVKDFNQNTYIDAQDLLADPRWADGVDTDKNGFADDFFGWNFRAGAGEPFAPNDPRDGLGHGTHVAGTIGAIGNNGRGVTGINWRSSLMSLKFLDDTNQGQISHAVLAVNYATMMRQDFGENVRVLNASWGQAGTESPALRTRIDAAGQAGMLFVAAAGNGNILGQGINLDSSPFYPASYALDNIIAVAATGPNDELARFSNFDATSVDLAAPGIGVLSTLPGGRYGTANGTSMAAPHVAGAAALIWSEIPYATAAEVRQAILGGAEPLAELTGRTVTSGRLNARRALQSDAFAPRATIDIAPNVTTAGGAGNWITVRYHDRQGLDTTSLGDGDLLVSRQWGPKDQLPTTLVSGSVHVTNDGLDVTATYLVTAPGGAWDVLDYGRYVVSVVEDHVHNRQGRMVPAGPIGEFSVRIADPSVFYVDTVDDAVDAIVGNGICAAASGKCTLRAAIQESNAARPAARTIILDRETYRLSIPPVADPSVVFPSPNSCIVDPGIRTWSNERTGDLDVLGNITLVGDDAATSVIDAGRLDRVFRVYPQATLDLRRVRVSGGYVWNVGGGGILSAGTLNLDLATVADNSVYGESGFGGGIAVWGGFSDIVDTTVLDNTASSGGGVFVCNQASVNTTRSTVMTNTAMRAGGGVYSLGGTIEVANSTLSNNEASSGGAIHALPSGGSFRPSVSADGRFVAFYSEASNLVPGDTNGWSDVFVLDRQNGTVERVSIAGDGTQGGWYSFSPSLSADGTVIAFESYASNLVPGDTNGVCDVFVFDRETGTLERISVGSGGTQGNRTSQSPSVSADGRFVVFQSEATNLVPGDTNGAWDVFVFDRQTRTLERVSVDIGGAQGNGDSWSPTLSSDGRFVAFGSVATNLVPGDTNGMIDVFVFDRQTRMVERVSVASDGTQANGNSGAPHYQPSLSADGRFVAFDSNASNLVSGDTNATSDVFVFDRQTHTMERVSVAADGTQGDSFGSESPTLSADGRFVAFASSATTLVPGDTNGEVDVFVVDRSERTIERVSVATGGIQADGPNSWIIGPPSLSADGRFVAFNSGASDLVPGDTNARSDVFLFDRQTRLQRRISSGNVPSYIFLESATVAENRTAAGPAVEGSVSIHNSLLVGNVHNLPYMALDLSAGAESLGYNLLESADAFTPQSTDRVDPFTKKQLGPLQNNGGPTWTHALLPGSPAIDGGNPLAYLSTDQRGVARPQDGDGQFGARTDIGAFEVYQATIQGVVFLDRNRDGKWDVDEPGLPGSRVFLDINGDGTYAGGVPLVVAQSDDPSTRTKLEDGLFSFVGLIPGNYYVAPLVETGWRQTLPGLERVSVANDDTQSNENSPWLQPSLSGDGRLVAFASHASNLVPGDTNGVGDIFVFDRQTRTIERVSVAADGTQGNSASDMPSMSADGRFVAFRSYASNLVPGDTNGYSDTFVFDRQSRTIERVSIATDGAQGNRESDSPKLNANGRFVAFSSASSNLVPGDTNGQWDIFVFDRQSRTIERVSVATDGTQGNSYSYSPSLSADGRFVAFSSGASNLVPGDTDSQSDVFVFDRQSGTIELISVADDGGASNGESNSPFLSADGRFVAFQSEATNLVPGDTNGLMDVFVFDRQTRAMERVNVASDGRQANGSGATYSRPSLSADGRFVAFESYASNLVPGDTNGTADVFIFDRQTRMIERVSISANGTNSNDWSTFPSLSADGRFFAFQSFASNLVPRDSNGAYDVFVGPNPNAPGIGSESVSLFAGQLLSNINFGLAPDPGDIRGQCFEDLITNGIYDVGEPGWANCTVYLDANASGHWDAGELKTQTAADGTYVFSQLDSYREYQVGVIVPDGFTRVLPTADENGMWKVFLPAGGAIKDRDFGFRKSPTGGQFENAIVAGRLFSDTNGNGRHDPGEPGISGVELFLDLNDDGVRQYDEPRTISAGDDPNTAADESGQYSFGNLGNRPYTVRVLNVPHYLQTAPIGNRLARQEYSLAVSGTPLGNPRDVALGDFNGDGWLDLVAVIYERNSVALLLNDGQGGFSQPLIEIPLAPGERPTTQPRGLGPFSLLVGEFNGGGGLDLAVANSLSSNVAILLDFDGQRFTSEEYVNVGLWPHAITGTDLDGDGDLDLIVTNDLMAGGATKNLSILRNNGQGKFTADAAPPMVGNRPRAVVTGDFNEDGRPDFAVADFGMHPSGADFGDVRVLLAKADGSFTSHVACPVGIGPTALVAADLNGDDHLDLAVANFLSNDVTVCLGVGNGTFQAALTLSGGTGPMDLAAADVDGDGDLDLLVASGTSQTISILRNRSTLEQLAFDPAETFGAGNWKLPARVSLAVGDVDRNGIVDLAVVISEANKAAVHLNALVGGAQRLALTGVETETGIDFGFQPVNAPPTLDGIADLAAINEDAGQQTVTLSGISAGVGELQPLRVTASSDHPELVASVAVDYTSPAAVGAIRFAPLPDRSGRAVITVTVTDGGLDGDLNTAADNGTLSRSFTVTVQPVNDPPTLDAIADQPPVIQDAPQQLIALSGISSGGGESQPVQITATSSNSALIPNPTITYTAGSTAGTLKYQPAAGQYGTATITVLVTDGGLDNDLGTATDNASVTRAFAVSVVPRNELPTLDTIPDAKIVNTGTGPQTVWLTGISAGAGENQPLRITATSKNPVLIPPPTIEYTAGSATGILRYEPAANQYGLTVIAVTVTDGGPDRNLDTTQDNARFAQAFAVMVTPVNAPPTLDAIRRPAPVGNGTAEQQAALTGIGPGAGETQPLLVTAVSDSPSLLSSLVADYQPLDSTGTLRYTPADGAAGRVRITVTVMDGGWDENLATLDDNASFSQVLRVVVTPNGLPPWQNPGLRYNVDGKFGVEPLDVLLIINYLNANGAGELPIPPPSPGVPPPFVDVNGDNDVTPVDVLEVINVINRSASALAAAGEGESTTVVSKQAQVPALTARLANLGAETGQPKTPNSDAHVWAGTRGAAVWNAVGDEKWRPWPSTTAAWYAPGASRGRPSRVAWPQPLGRGIGELDLDGTLDLLAEDVAEAVSGEQWIRDAK